MFFDDLNLRATHETIREALKLTIEDWDKLETCMTKTDDGMIFEIRKAQQGKLFRADALTVNELYEKLAYYRKLDTLSATVEALAHQVGRLADTQDANRGK